MAELFSFLTAWLAPIAVFTAEEAWLARPKDMPDGGKDSVHLRTYPEIPSAWLDAALGEKWKTVRALRRVVTGALELARADKKIGASLEAAPVIHIADPALRAALAGVDMAEVAITSGVEVQAGEGPADAFRLPDVAGVAVEFRPAQGRKCARSWKILPSVGSDPEYPDVSPRDAQALREWDALRRAAE
jgi:isoleucyl-tRNA synthetase